MKLRDYQLDAKNKILNRINQKNVLFVLSTGGGKTVILSHVVRDYNQPTVLIAHRDQILSQLSLALAQQNIKHNIIANNNVIKTCIRLHMSHVERSYYQHDASVYVCSVDTLARKKYEMIESWASKIKLWIQDEAHHVLRENKWGKAVKLFPNARGLGVTATPVRCDGKGLGKVNDGVFDEIIEGKPMRELIDEKYLCDYKIFIPPSDIHFERIKISKSTGEFNKNQLKNEVHQSKIVGDIVEHYQKLTPDKLALVFAVDMIAAKQITDKFNSAGITCALVNAKTLTIERYQIMDDFKARKIQVIVNVDLYDEGVDIPVLEVVIMARPTMSYSKYSQMFGRVLRLMNGKDYGIVIDCVGNVMRHGLPDSVRNWTLYGRKKNKKSENNTLIVKIKRCDNCYAAYNAQMKSCPFCKFTPTVTVRRRLQEVEGDLTLLTPEQLQEMRGQIILKTEDAIIQEMQMKGAPLVGVRTAAKRQRELIETQNQLRKLINNYGESMRQLQISDSDSYKNFQKMFGVDILTAQTLNLNESKELLKKCEKQIF